MSTNPPPLTSTKPSQRKGLPLWLLLMALLAIVGPATIDMYLAAFPDIAGDFAIPMQQVELTVAVFLFGISACQLIVGPMTDRIGRKLPLLVGALIYLGGSALCALSPNVTVLLIGRVVQALGASTFMVISRAVVRDHYETKDAATAMTLLMLLTGLAPILAPIVGSWLVVFVSWRGLFIILSLYGLLCFVLIATLFKESLPHDKCLIIRPQQLLQHYLELLKHRQFMGFSVAAGMSMGAMFAFISSSANILINVYDLSVHQFSYAFAIASLGALLGSQFCGFLLRRGAGTLRVFQLNVIAALCSLSVGALLAWTDHLSLMGFMAVIFLFTCALGAINPTAPILALQQQGHRLGMGSALTGSMLFLFGTVASTIVSRWYTGTALPLLLTMLGYMVIAFVCGHLAAQYKSNKPLS